MLCTVQSALHIISHLIRSILQTRKLSLKEVRILAQGHLDGAEGNVVTKPASSQTPCLVHKTCPMNAMEMSKDKES